MQVSYTWLSEYLTDIQDPQTLAERLSLAGLVAEAVEPEGDDWVLHFERLPNRPDWLSVRGIARETAAICRGQLNDLPEPFCYTESQPDLTVSIIDQDRCARYAACVIEGITVGPSPEWIQDRLMKSGIRAINNVVDITNYVLLEYGHPLHAFDYQTIAEKAIHVRYARKGETLVTLDGVSRELDSTMLVIADAEKPIAIAGIMGGAATEVHLETRTIVLESAYFDPSSVRATARQLGLDTEASYRFERGADVDAVRVAMDRACTLLCDIAGGQIQSACVDQYPNVIIPHEIIFSNADVNGLLGTTLSDPQIISHLEALGIDVSQEKNVDFLAVIPNFRRDITRKEDLVEEVARVYGYDNIPTTLPHMRLDAKSPHAEDVLCVQIMQRLMAHGFSETITYSFIAAHDQEDDMSIIRLLHPLAETQAVMRQTLLPGLLRTIASNRSFNHDAHLSFYEMGKTYARTETHIVETEQVALVSTSDFLFLKGVVVDCLTAIGFPDVIFVPANDSWYETGHACEMIVHEKRIGMIGMLADQKQTLFGLKESLVICQINRDCLPLKSAIKAHYQSLPRYPASKRDLAVIMTEAMTYDEVTSFIRDVENPFLCDMKLVEIYRGKQVPKGKKSMAFSLTFRDPERTLHDDEVNVVFHRIIEALRDKKQITLREQ